ncbi:MAG: hypothetical protein IPG53_23810 [Ignavibacteriales bacterium]|nr:hypothetical protein [Ignavibacteriales bacterium]
MFFRVLNEAKTITPNKSESRISNCCKDEEIIGVHEKLNIKRNAKGIPESISGIVTDTTKLKLRQFDLRTIRDKFKN